ncbi:hypothetical protein A2U01_0092318 [Trifolium medium]|uniref:Uncharacterized protein n=1 Tax=Trifolium medium TaxID=97028 RepID=A0A392UH53_9FABA|nr:hypothetical protein [Trifolium medium]
MVRRRVELAPCIESLLTKVVRRRVPWSSVAYGGTSVVYLKKLPLEGEQIQEWMNSHLRGRLLWQV